MKQKAISATLWGMTILGFFIVCGLLYDAQCNPKTLSILSSIPLGSGLADLERIHKQWDVDREARVMQWIPTNKSPSESDLLRDGDIRKTEFGTFLQKDIGPFELLSKPEELSKLSKFTGTITFFHPYGFGNADVIELTYISGRLRKKDYGHLPS